MKAQVLGAQRSAMVILMAGSAVFMLELCGLGSVVRGQDPEPANPVLGIEGEASDLEDEGSMSAPLDAVEAEVLQLGSVGEVEAGIEDSTIAVAINVLDRRELASLARLDINADGIGVAFARVSPDDLNRLDKLGIDWHQLGTEESLNRAPAWLLEAQIEGGSDGTVAAGDPFKIIGVHFEDCSGNQTCPKAGECYKIYVEIENQSSYVFGHYLDTLTVGTPPNACVWSGEYYLPWDNRVFYCTGTVASTAYCQTRSAAVKLEDEGGVPDQTTFTCTPPANELR